MENKNIEKSNIENKKADKGMKKSEDTIKIKKWFMSIRKEKMWLQEQALKGLKLKNIVMGINFEFEKIEPARLVYEIDRFDIPKNPSLGEIKQKEEFMIMADEMGWQEVTHDEDMNYYFCKEYEEDGINELYNDFESRQIHAQKYKKRYTNLGDLFIKLMIMITVMCIVIIALRDREEGFDTFTKGYIIFSLLYNVFGLAFVSIGNYLSEYYYNELILSEEEWIKSNAYLEKETKKIRKLFFRTSKFRKFLANQAKEGWHIAKIGVITYVFIKGEKDDCTYILDSQGLTNKRLSYQGEKKLSDSKDINKIGNEWQVKSVKNAKESGYEFVTAYKNNLIIYKAKNKDINVNKQPLIGLFLNKIVIVMAVAGLVGGIAGFVIAIIK